MFLAIGIQEILFVIIAGGLLAVFAFSYGKKVFLLAFTSKTPEKYSGQGRWAILVIAGLVAGLLAATFGVEPDKGKPPAPGKTANAPSDPAKPAAVSESGMLSRLTAQTFQGVGVGKGLRTALGSAYLIVYSILGLMSLVAVIRHSSAILEPYPEVVAITTAFLAVAIAILKALLLTPS